MLPGMRALPGRASRTSLEDSAPGLTRETVAEAQRRRIRRATGELVAKRGYAGVRVELIVKRARVSFKTFYKHYVGKEAAFIDLFERATAVTEAQVLAALEETKGPWPEQVAVALTAFFESIIAEPLIARACLVEGPTAGPQILQHYERVAKAFAPILSQGRTYNPKAADLPGTLEDTLAGAVLWSAYQRLNFSETDRIAELIPENIELVLRPYIGEAEASRVAARRVAAGA
jgi:AcrR family transcriptional regulator